MVQAQSKPKKGIDAVDLDEIHTERKVCDREQICKSLPEINYKEVKTDALRLIKAAKTPIGYY